MPNKTPALIVDDIHKVYPSGTHALKGVSLTVNAGDFYALLGMNGAGKSTLINSIAGLTNITTGRVSIFGHDIEAESTEARRLIGIVPQEFNFPVFYKVEQILLNYAGYYGIPRKVACKRIGGILEKLGLSDKCHTQARQLSGGMKRRLMIARAMMLDPQLLILDEPTAGVDVHLRQLTWDLLQDLNKQGKTIILTTHYMEEAEFLCNRVGIIHHGKKIQEGAMHECLTDFNEDEWEFTVANPIDQLPVIPGITFEVRSDRVVHATVTDTEQLQAILCEFKKAGNPVIWPKNISNRLESLLTELTTNAD